MEMTIIGVYDHLAQARSAKNELIASGFPRSAVQLNPDHDLTEKDDPAVQESGSLNASIGNFFRTLFSMDNKSTYSNVYGEAVKRGSYVLTVDVDSDVHRVQAEEIMAHHGLVDIDERSADWIRRGWRGYDPNAHAHAPASAQAGNPSNAGRIRAILRGTKNGGPQ